MSKERCPMCKGVHDYGECQADPRTISLSDKLRALATTQTGWAEETVTKAADEIDRLIRQLAEARTEAARLLELHGKQCDDWNKLIVSGARIEDERDAARQALAEARAQYDALNVDVLEEDLVETRRERDIARQELAEARAQLDVVENGRAEAERERDEDWRRANKAEHDRDAARQELAVARAHITGLNVKLGICRNRRDAARQALAAARNETIEMCAGYVERQRSGVHNDEWDVACTTVARYLRALKSPSPDGQS